MQKSTAPQENGIKLNCGGYDFEGVEVTSAHMNLPSKFKVGDVVLGTNLRNVPLGSILIGEFGDDNIGMIVVDGLRRYSWGATSAFDGLLGYYKWTLLYVND